MLNLGRSVVGVVAVLLMSGMASAQTQTATNLKTGIFVINPQFDDTRPFSEGLAAVRIGDEWGFIDTTGSYVINPQFDIAGRFFEGLAAVRIGDDETGKWGFIDTTGSVVINPQFDDARPFSDGLAVASISGRYGFIAR